MLTASGRARQLRRGAAGVRLSIATLGNSGVVTTSSGSTEFGWSLYNFWGLALVYLYFLCR